MSPEQITDIENVGPASDVYGLGAVLYELLSGKPPFKRDSLLDTIDAVKSLPPVAIRKKRTGVPADLEAICLKCLEKKPEQRYASAAELQADLNRYLKNEPVSARTIGPSPKRFAGANEIHCRRLCWRWPR